MNTLLGKVNTLNKIIELEIIKVKSIDYFLKK